MTKLRRVLPLLALLSLLLCAAPALAAAEPEGWAYDVWNELMSPFCPGRSLADCPSSQAESLRMWIVAQEAAGASKDEVEQQIYERYGDVVLSAPRAQGIGITAYVIPVVTFVAGGLLVAVFLRRQTRRPEAPREGPSERRPAAEPLDPELERLVDEELAR
jgi:cytochrome c-type biogenesis protein CcmH